MSHSMKNFPAELLAGLLAAVTDANATMIPLELDGNGPIDEQIERAMEGAAAHHRETCETCRELHAEFGPKNESAEKNPPDWFDSTKPATAGIPDLATYSKEQLARQHKIQIMELEKKHAAEREELIRSFEPAEKSAPKTPSTDTSVIGYMAFVDDEPIASSFDTDRDCVERATKLAAMLRLYRGKLTVKAVRA